MSLALHGCTSASGGAVELSWNLIDAEGNKGGCDPTKQQIASVWLRWDVGGELGDQPFGCTNASTGVTGFRVPAKPDTPALLWVEPHCLNGDAVDAADYIAPAPLQRDVVAGDVIELHAVVIQILSSAPCP